MENIKKGTGGLVIFLVFLGVINFAASMNRADSYTDEISKDMDNATGENTEEVLKNVDIDMGSFEVITDEYGFSETKLVVNVTNKANERKSYNIEIEAVATDGSRIDIDYIYANNLGAGQSQNFDIFTYVSSEDLEAMQNATFDVVEVSMY